MRPSRATTNENSPIWATARPASRATRAEYAISAGPAAAISALPATTTTTPPTVRNGFLRRKSNCTSIPGGDEEERDEDVAEREQLGQRLVPVIGFRDHEAGQESPE